MTGTLYTCLHTNQSRSYLNHIVAMYIQPFKVGRVAQSVYWLTTGWTVRGSNSGKVRFSVRPDQPWGHPASCTMCIGPFPGVKYGRGVLLTTHPLLVPRSWKSRAVPVTTLWATTEPVTGTLYLYSLSNHKIIPVVFFLLGVSPASEFYVWAG
jgi:hypothetical protein